MKCQIIISFVFLFASASAVHRFDDQLRELVESLRQQLPCGFPAAGIPALAPYLKDLHQFDLTNVGMDLAGNFTNLTLTGIDSFDIKQLNFASLLMKLNFDVNFNEIQILSQYYAKGGLKIFGRNVSLVGDGIFHLIGQNIRINGSFFLRPTTSNGLKIWKFKSSFNMDAVQSRTTGIANSPLYTSFFNAWVEEVFRITIAENSDHIARKIESVVVPFVNEQFKKVSIIELVAVILGVGAPGPLFPVCEV